MKYKLSNELKKVKSPIHIVAPIDMSFENGDRLCEYEFDKYYLVENILATNGTIEIVLKENNQINSIDWVGEEQVSFF